MSVNLFAFAGRALPFFVMMAVEGVRAATSDRNL